jgi:hypothetical protein
VIDYPATLPRPTRASHASKDRASASDLPGLLAAVSRERDYCGTMDVAFFFTAEQAAIFYTFWRDTLYRGGAWFNANWPALRPGTLVCQFLVEPVFSHVYMGAFKVTGKVQVRGVSEAVVGPSTPTWTIFFGEDGNNSATTPLTTLTNSDAAQAAFAAVLSSPGVEDFESQTVGVITTLNLTFPKEGGGTIAAALTGTNLQVFSQTAGTAAAGRYSIPSATSSRFLRVATTVAAGAITIALDQDVHAIGFYGIDVSDFGGTLTVVLKDSLGAVVRTEVVPATDGSITPNDGAVLFWGIVGGGGNVFRSVEMTTTLGGGDIIGIDLLQIQ